VARLTYLLESLIPFLYKERYFSGETLANSPRDWAVPRLTPQSESLIPFS